MLIDLAKHLSERMLPQPILQKLKNTVKRYRNRSDDPSKELRACHLSDLFVTSDGGVYPCCMAASRPDLRIAEIADPKLIAKIKAFKSKYCSCRQYVLRDAQPLELPAYKRLNLELSLACQASCSMCCVGSDEWTGTYDLYSKLERLVAYCQPSIELLVQGGEVLSQKQSVAWLAKLKEAHPSIRFGLVTNGCFPVGTTKVVEGLFYRATVSMVGFQPETYERIMGLKLERTQAFVRQLITDGKTSVFLKYLTTPLSIHEVALFVEWAIEVGPKMIQVIDSGFHGYVKMDTCDRFWAKTLEKTGIRLRRTLVEKSSILREKRIPILIDRASCQQFGISEAFLNEFALNDIVRAAELYPDEELLAF